MDHNAGSNVFSRLTPLQQKYINKTLFNEAYNIVTNFDTKEEIKTYVLEKYSSQAYGCTNEAADVLRYCNLVKRIQ
jgi:hypothetical protein